MDAVDVDSVPPRTPLPRFLKPWKSPHWQGSCAHAPTPIHTVYDHQRPFGQAQVLWWPPGMRACDSAVVPRTILLFIPGTCPSLARRAFSESESAMAATCVLFLGWFILLLLLRLGNPGLLDFYVPFLNAIHRGTISESEDLDSDSDSDSAGSSSSVTIFAHAHLGLSSYVGIDTDGPFSFPETSRVALPAQIQAHAEFLDELLSAYGPAPRVLLVGHSIGAWLVQEVLKARPALRPRVGAYMLFPTLSHIGQTPCGRTYSVRLRPFGSSSRVPDAFFLHSSLGATTQAFLSPAVAPHTGISLPAPPAHSPVGDPPLSAFLARERARPARPVGPAAHARGHLRGADDGARRDADGARPRRGLPPRVRRERVVLLCRGGRLGRRAAGGRAARVARHARGESRGTWPRWHPSCVLHQCGVFSRLVNVL